MGRIEARSKSVREMLSGVKYSIDYYQREYRWETKNIEELLDDLENKFIGDFDEQHDRTEVQKYASYFLGSVVLSDKDGKKFIIDGQQRLTSLTLLLTFLHHMQSDRKDGVDVKSLIFSEKYGKKSFNIDVQERTACMDAIFGGLDFDATGRDESVQNIVSRYHDFEELFPETLKEKALPYFVDWLLDNVQLVEIAATSDDDAYTIFETMNDRGLSLSPTEMLKGYLLSNVRDPEEKGTINAFWKARVLELIEIAKEEETDFFKAWLRAKHADTIRDRKAGATNKDFERIGTGYHKWVREERTKLRLTHSQDFQDFVMKRFDHFSKEYVRIRKASLKMTKDLAHVYYNAVNNFTLQDPLLLAPLTADDDEAETVKKIRLVSQFVDNWIARRVVNYKTLGYSSIVYTMFQLMKEVRDLDSPTLAVTLVKKLEGMEETFQGVDSFSLHQMNRQRVHHLLARITRHVERKSGVASRFEDYVSRDLRKPFEIEHIWADKYERLNKDFASETEFEDSRNMIGGLLLLPQGFNQSLNDDTYEVKVKAYFGQNLLAKSLSEECYKNNPSFLAYVRQSGLPFKPHKEFKKKDLFERQQLYRKICEEIWSPSHLMAEIAP